MDDEQIIQLYNLRNAQALTETTKKYGAVCYQTANKILNDTQDTEECVNDALMKVWNTIPPQHPENLAAFLVTITRNLAFNKWKHNERIKRGGGQITLMLDELSDCVRGYDDVEKSVDVRVLVKSIELFLDTLSYDARTIFVQRYIAMRSINEIANEYEISVSKVKMSLLRTRKQLRKKLKKEGWL